LFQKRGKTTAKVLNMPEKKWLFKWEIIIFLNVRVD
jgi:hypothetical protein